MEVNHKNTFFFIKLPNLFRIVLKKWSYILTDKSKDINTSRKGSEIEPNIQFQSILDVFKKLKGVNNLCVRAYPSVSDMRNYKIPNVDENN